MHGTAARISHAHLISVDAWSLRETLDNCFDLVVDQDPALFQFVHFRLHRSAASFKRHFSLRVYPSATVGQNGVIDCADTRPSWASLSCREASVLSPCSCLSSLPGAVSVALCLLPLPAICFAADCLGYALLP